MHRHADITNPRVRIAMWMIFMVVGAILAAVGLLLLLGRGVDKKRCTQPVTAVVVDLEKRASHSRKRHTTSITYAPVFEYEFRGETFRHTSSISTNPPRLSIGQRAELMIDPDKPSTVYDKSGAADVACTIVMGVGAFLILFGSVGVSLSAKRAKQGNKDTLPPM